MGRRSGPLLLLALLSALATWAVLWVFLRSGPAQPCRSRHPMLWRGLPWAVLCSAAMLTLVRRPICRRGSSFRAAALAILLVVGLALACLLFTR